MKLKSPKTNDNFWPFLTFLTTVAIVKASSLNNTGISNHSLETPLRLSPKTVLSLINLWINNYRKSRMSDNNILINNREFVELALMKWTIKS